MHHLSHSHNAQAIACGALLHFRSLSSPDPHNISEDEAASAHVYNQETRFFRQLNEHLRGTDRSKIEPYKPYAFPCGPSLKNNTFLLTRCLSAS